MYINLLYDNLRLYANIFFMRLLKGEDQPALKDHPLLVLHHSEHCTSEIMQELVWKLKKSLKTYFTWKVFHLQLVYFVMAYNLNLQPYCHDHVDFSELIQALWITLITMLSHNIHLPCMHALCVISQLTKMHIKNKVDSKWERLRSFTQT